MLIAHVSPEPADLAESLSTLSFADRAGRMRRQVRLPILIGSLAAGPVIESLVQPQAKWYIMHLHRKCIKHFVLADGQRPGLRPGCHQLRQRWQPPHFA